MDHGRWARTVNHKWRSVAVYLACGSPRSIIIVMAFIYVCGVVVLFETITTVIGWGVGGVCVRDTAFTIRRLRRYILMCTNVYTIFHLYYYTPLLFLLPLPPPLTTPPTAPPPPETILPPLIQQPLLRTIVSVLYPNHKTYSAETHNQH